MNTTKIIKGVVNSGRYTVTAPIVKEDYGLYLQIEGVELPETYQVDFSNSENSGTSVTMIGNADGVLIPRQFIDSGKDVFAFLYHVGDNYGRTVFKFRIPNKLRPDRTDEEPTPEQASTIDQTISALNTAVAKTAQDVIDADEAASDALQAVTSAALARDAAGEYARRADTAASNAETSAESASVSANASAQSAQSAERSAQTASAKADAITGLTATATTLPDGSSATANYNPETGVMSFGIPKGKDGIDGDDGYSPTASVSKSGKTATITITDKNGTTSAQVEDGTDGTDGISPTVTITPITGGHRVTITDAGGSHSVDVMDGDDYILTEQDKQDIAELVDVPVDDVQINGQSIVENGIANVPLSSTDEFGVVKVIGEAYGVTSSEGRLFIEKANDAQVQNGTNNFKPIVPSNQHSATFYGLAKASGDATQIQSANPVGTYTDDAKEAIQNMLGVPSNDDVVNDVQINGTSIVTNGVANVPLADYNALGVTKLDSSRGIFNNNGFATIYPAQGSDIKTSNGQRRPITPTYQHQSVFYGLAKASGDTTQSASSNEVGNYTDTAKSKIQTMLGIADLIGNSEGTTASKAYSVGNVLLHDGKLYKVTASIAQGSAIVPNTNCTQTTIIDLLRGV